MRRWPQMPRGFNSPGPFFWVGDPRPRCPACFSKDRCPRNPSMHASMRPHGLMKQARRGSMPRVLLTPVRQLATASGQVGRWLWNFPEGGLETVLSPTARARAGPHGKWVGPTPNMSTFSRGCPLSWQAGKEPQFSAQPSHNEQRRLSSPVSAEQIVIPHVDCTSRRCGPCVLGLTRLQTSMSKFLNDSSM